MKIRYILLLFAALLAYMPAGAAVRTNLGRPDLDSIRMATTDENSEYYYPRLLKEFMANDTSMTDEAFQHFYYGAFFQEDYDPYRPSGNHDLQAELAPLFSKKELTRSERKQIMEYARACIEDNPLNLKQLANLIFVYEQNRKYDLAKIWQYKLNHLLLVILTSGTGSDPENAWIVVYPQNEYEFLNLSGLTAIEQKFEPPYYDHIVVKPRTENSPKDYYFNISEILRQYYLKHPSELEE